MFAKKILELNAEGRQSTLNPALRNWKKLISAA
jgi:hypothetical protein